MTEKWLNETIESVVNALKLRRWDLTEEELFYLMYRNENIYQTVHSKFCNEKKARLIIREIKRVNGSEEQPRFHPILFLRKKKKWKSYNCS